MADEVLDPNAEPGEGVDTPPAQPLPDGRGSETQPDAKALADEIKALRGQLSEKDEAVRYWHGQAQGGGRRNEPAAGAPAEPEDSTDLLDLIGTKGAKGLNAQLKKSGFVTGADVEEMVEKRAGQLVREQRLVSDYPDLANHNSEFFKSTAKEYGRLLGQGMPKGLAMEQAAGNVKLRELQAGGAAPDAAAQAEAERQRRIRAQGGDRGNRGGTPQPREDDELSDAQKRIADAMGITHDAYKKRAKAGVQYAGKQ